MEGEQRGDGLPKLAVTYKDYVAMIPPGSAVSAVNHSSRNI